MRKQINSEPKMFDTRVITVFLLLSRTINNERRWLEVATIKQQCTRRNVWSDVEWVNH